MTKGGPGSATLLASTYDYTIFEQGSSRPDGPAGGS